MKNLYIIFCIFLNVSFTKTYSQNVEYVADFDYSNVLPTRITTSFGNMSVNPKTTYDHQNKRFFFQGKTSSAGWNLYCVNTQTGALINQFNNIITGTASIFSIHYSHTNDTLYAICSTGAMSTAFYLAWIDQTNGSVHTKCQLPSLGYVINTECTFDEQHNRIIFIASDVNNVYRLYTLDAYTGNIIYQPAYSYPYIRDLNYNNTDGHLYGITYDSNVQLDTFELATGIGHPVVYLPLHSIVSRNTSVMDEAHHKMIYVHNGTSVDSIITVDLQSHTIIDRKVYPYDPVGGLFGYENLVGYCYDTTANTIYCLNWGPSSGEPTMDIINETEDMPKLYPNPTDGRIFLSYQKSMDIIEFFDPNGQLVQRFFSGKESEELDLSGLQPGTYFLNVQSNGVVSCQKIVIR